MVRIRTSKLLQEGGKNSLKVLLFFLSIILLTNSAFASITCSVESSCTGGAVDFGGMYQLNNSHYENSSESNYNNRICCSSDSTISNSCSGSYVVFIRAYNVTNSHVEQGDQATGGYFDICMNTDNGTLSVSYDTSCSETCMFEISNTTNAHVGDCNSPYTTKVCISHTPETGGGSGVIPEFSDYAIVLILIMIVGGFLIIKRGRKK